MLSGLYAITDRLLAPGDQLETAVAAALRGGARVIQYRDKRSDPVRRRRQVESLLRLCQAHNALLIVNDDLDLAVQCGAHGVHLGKDDLDIGMARQRLPHGALLGVSCYNDLARARQAAEQGADYLAFGRFFPSRSKPDASAASLETLQVARCEIALPLVAIGGITPENGAPLIEAGADMLAAIHGVFGQPDIEAAARRFSDLFTDQTSRRSGG